MLKSKLAIVVFIFLVIFLMSNKGYSALRYDYNLDLSPIINDEGMFSAGLALTLSEYNAWFRNGELFYETPATTNLSVRLMYIPFMAYFEVRPWKFLEIAVAPVLMYKVEDSRNNLSNLTNQTDSILFEGIHFHSKVTIVNWYISLGFRLDVDYSFYYGASLPNETLPDNLDVAGTLMFGIIPKVFPLNLLFDYRVHSESTLLNLGEAVLALEYITSKMITLYAGATFVFPYLPDVDDTMYIEPFIKFAVSFDEFLLIDVIYRKVIYGEGDNFTPNNSTFMFSVEYVF